LSPFWKKIKAAGMIDPGGFIFCVRQAVPLSLFA